MGFLDSIQAVFRNRNHDSRIGAADESKYNISANNNWAGLVCARLHNRIQIFGGTMTIVLEIGRPFWIIPFLFVSEICIRFGWGWFAIAIHNKSYAEIIRTAQWVSQDSPYKNIRIQQ